MNTVDHARKELGKAWGIPWRLIRVRVVRVRERSLSPDVYRRLRITTAGGERGGVACVSRRELLRDAAEWFPDYPPPTR